MKNKNEQQKLYSFRGYVKFLQRKKGEVVMNIYFIILCVLMLLNLGVALAKDGELREREKISFVRTLIVCVFQFVMIYMAIKTGF